MRPIQPGHIGGKGPPDLAVFRQSRRAADEMADERGEYDGSEIIVIGGHAHLVGNLDLTEQLLFDLTMQRLACGFMRFDLAAGELLIPGQGPAFATPGAEHLPIADDCRPDDIDDFPWRVRNVVHACAPSTSRNQDQDTTIGGVSRNTMPVRHVSRTCVEDSPVQVQCNRCCHRYTAVFSPLSILNRIEASTFIMISSMAVPFVIVV